MLGLLSAEPARAILAALRENPLRPSDLEREHLISHSTLHRYLAELEAHGAVEKRELASPPHAVEYALAHSGGELHRLVRDVEGWLRVRPIRPLDPASKSAWKAVSALGQGWTDGIMQRLLAQPLSAVEMAALWGTLTRHEAEGRLTKLRDMGILAGDRGSGGMVRYALTDWGRRGAGVLSVALRWEHLHCPAQAVLPSLQDSIARLRAALPLVRPDAGVEGLCEFTVTTHSSEPGGGADTAWAEVGGGCCLGCGQGPPPRPADAWTRGSPVEWLSAVIDRRFQDLRAGGDAALAQHLVHELHEQLHGYGR